MHREYHKWRSPALGRDMELLVAGHGGKPVLVFPSSMGRFYEYEDRGMIGAQAEKYEWGHLQAFCVDSVDTESWYNRGAHPADRVRRHERYEEYLLNEVLPLIRHKNQGALTVTGASFGGYHSMNFAMRHPDIVSECVSMGGAFDIAQFLDGWADDSGFFQRPMAYLPSMTDEWYLSRYRRMRIVLGTGEHDICLDENLRMGGILTAKGIPHWLDVLGDGGGHDWPWWRLMAQKYL